MLNANVVHIDDEQAVRDLAKRFLALDDHVVSGEAETLGGGLRCLAEIKAGELLCDALVLDGNLSFESSECSDAKTIIERYHKLGLNIPIIGYSGSSFIDNGIAIPGKFDIGKNPSRLLELINSL